VGGCLGLRAGGVREGRMPEGCVTKGGLRGVFRVAMRGEGGQTGRGQEAAGGRACSRRALAVRAGSGSCRRRLPGCTLSAATPSLWQTALDHYWQVKPQLFTAASSCSPLLLCVDVLSAGGATGGLSDVRGGDTGGLADVSGGEVGGLSDIQGGETGGLADIQEGGRVRGRSLRDVGPDPY